MQIFREAVTLWHNRPAYRAYALLLLAALVWQCIRPALFIDSHEYLNAAGNLLRNGLPEACLSPESCDLLLPETRRTPGYPGIILATVWVPLLLTLQTLIAALVPVLMLRIANALELGSRAQMVMMWLLFVYPLQYYYAPMLMPEIWVQFTLLIGLWCWVSGRQHWVPVCITALVLLKPVFLPAAVLCVLLVFKLPLRHKWVSVLPLVVVLLVSANHARKTGVFHYTSIATVNAYEYNVRPLVKLSVSDDQYYRRQDSIMQPMTFAGRYNHIKSLTAHWLKTYPLQYAWLHARGGLLALADPGRYDCVAFFGLKSGPGFMNIREKGGWAALRSQPLWMLAYLAVFSLLALIRTALALLAVVRRFRSAIVLLIPVIYILALTGPVGSARYLMPVAPFLFMLAGIGAGLLKSEKTA